MLRLTIEEGTFSDFTQFGGGSVEVLRSGDNCTFSISETLLDLDIIIQVFVGSCVRLISHHLGRLEGDIMTGLLMTIVNLSPNDSLDKRLERVLNRHIRWLREQG